jgi:RNA polymerase sigma-70 factor, ECF subfamily
MTQTPAPVKRLPAVLPEPPHVTDDRSPAERAQEERALFARLGAGDEAAFDALFRAWYAPLVRIAEGIVRERAVAEEVVQDVLLEVWRRRERLGDEESPRAYLIRAARNRALNHLRHLRVQQRGAPYVGGRVESAPEGASRVVEEELDRAVRGAVAELPPRCREVFELSRVHGLSYAEIASSLEISVKTVEAQMGKALRTLRERLAAWLPGGDRGGG